MASAVSLSPSSLVRQEGSQVPTKVDSDSLYFRIMVAASIALTYLAFLAGATVMIVAIAHLKAHPMGAIITLVATPVITSIVCTIGATYAFLGALANALRPLEQPSNALNDFSGTR